MKSRLVYFGTVLATTSVAYGLAYNMIGPAALATKIVAPAVGYNFPGWDNCSNYYGGYLQRMDGTSLGESNRPTAIWPVGPNAFLLASHVKGSGPAQLGDPGYGMPITPTNVVMMGVNYPIIGSHLLHSDCMLLITTSTIPYWHAVWRGYTETTNVQINPTYVQIPGGALVLTGTTTNYISVPMSITNYGGFVISGGPFGDAVCSIPTGSATRSWQNVTNAFLKPADWATMSVRMASQIYVDTIPLTELYTFRYFPESGIANVGGNTGDSGGAMWLHDGTNWWLVGPINLAMNCPGSMIEGPVAWNAAIFRQEYWNLVGQTNEYTNAIILRQYFATNANYAICAGYTNQVAQTNAPPTNPPEVITNLPPVQGVPPYIPIPATNDDTAKVHRKLDLILSSIEQLRRALNKLLFATNTTNAIPQG